MKKQEEFSVSSEHLGLRIAGFVLAFLVAVGAFALAATRFGRKESGYQRIEAAADETAPMASSAVNFQYYLEGSSDEIKRAVNELQTVYSPALYRISKQLDAETEYEGIVNIAALNAHPGEDMKLSAELYRVLLDAQEKTREGRGYNLFAGPWYRAWREIRYLAEPQDFDPLRNADEAERLRQLLEAANESENCALVIVDAGEHIVRLEVSESYRALLAELEQEGPVMDLGLLHDAYELQLLAEALGQAGFRDGYLSMDSGVTAVLPGNPEGELCLYGRTDEGVTPAAVTPALGGRAASLMRAFALQEGEPDYYEIDGVYRHPWITVSGVSRNLLMAALVVADDPVTACYLDLQMQDCATAEELRSFAASSGAEIAYLLLADTEQTVHTDSAAITACEDYGWKIIRN